MRVAQAIQSAMTKQKTQDLDRLHFGIYIDRLIREERRRFQHEFVPGKILSRPWRSA